MPTEKLVTAEQALLWLAGLERECPQCCGSGRFMSAAESSVHDFCDQCKGDGKVPVLDLREPCPDCFSSKKMADKYRPGWDCLACAGCEWVPKRGEEALRQAMHNDRWRMEAVWEIEQPYKVTFSKCMNRSNNFGVDSNPPVAAYKAMVAAGARFPPAS